MMRMKRLTALLLLLLTLTGAAFAEGETNSLLEVHQMMLGCADGYLVRLGDVTLLIDGGEANPRKPERGAAAYLREAGVTELDAVIITHWHLDHCMGLNDVLMEFGTEETVVYSPAADVPAEIFNGTVTVAVGPLTKGVHRQLRMGDVLEMGGMTLTVIGPEKLSLEGGCNQDSLNFVMQYGARRILFTGDFAQSGCIAGAYRELCAQVDALKFPHHAIEPFEISTAALRVVRPAHVLVPGVVNKYKLWNHADNAGVKFPRENVYTNADGHVVILTDGADVFEVRTQVAPADFAPGA